MNASSRKSTPWRWWLLAPCGALLTASLAPAQPTPTEPAATAGETLAADAAAAGDDTIQLNPFVVESSNQGYYAPSSLSGTRLNTKLENIASSITVITKQQLEDTASIDINDIFRNEANTEGTYQFTDFTQDRGFTVDNVAQNPQSANRIRGLSSGNAARGNYAASNAIPIDTYNIDSIEISRGPNSNIFGLGSASGTVNLMIARASTEKQSARITARADSSDGYRASFDFNQPLIENYLGIRLMGVHDHKEFERKPSLDKTNRFTGAFTFTPWRKTIIRGYYESYHNFNNRANSTTPRDSITEWRQYGSPTWDPVTQTARVGNQSWTVAANQEGTLLPRGLNPQFTGFWNRPGMWIVDGEIERYEVNRLPNAAAPFNPSNAGGTGRYLQNGTLYMRGGGAHRVVDASGNITNITAVQSPATPLFQALGTTDQSIYDWENINFAAPNYGRKQAEIFNVELEQFFIESERQLLALQAGHYHEKIDTMSRNFVGASDGAPPVILLDINERLLDGSPNPYFLRPYIGASEAQTFRYPEENDHSRAQLAYQLDFTGEDNWTKWLGLHRFLGYGEFREIKSVSNGYRYRDKIISDESWMAAGDLLNRRDRGAYSNSYSRYYLGDSIANGGSVVDYGAVRADPLGSQTLRWYNGQTSQWVTDDVEIGEVFFSQQNDQLQQVRSQGFIWQGFLLDERIVPTFGYRKDKSRTVGAVGFPLSPTTGFMDESTRGQYLNNWIEVGKPSRTYGIVVKPLKWLFLHYNQSDNFTPATTAYNLLGDPLPLPTGDGKDYGFTLNLLDNKLILRVNKYETFQKDSRSGSTAVLASRPLRMDFDLGADTAVGGFDLEDNALNWVTQLRYGFSATPGTIFAALTPAQQAEVVADAYTNYLKLDPAEVAAMKVLSPLSDINDIESKGLEFELNYNPTDYWTIKLTATKQQAVDQALSPFIPLYQAQRLDVWTTTVIPNAILNDPVTGQPAWMDPATRLQVPAGTAGAVPARLAGAGLLWYDFQASSDGTPRNWYAVNVDAPYNLAVTNSGKPRPQTREWRAAVTSNFRFKGVTDNKWLKNLSVGGTGRWEDEAVIGFMGQAPDADGVIRRLDGTKPIYDKSRTYFDFVATYRTKILDNKIGMSIQLNVNNAFESGRLQAISVNPDGTPWNYRIIDPRQFIVSTTFDF